jgi:tetratricopeptide (TPR) repeat protein
MRDSGWMALAAGLLAGLALAAPAASAATASQAATQALETRTDFHFDLDPSPYPDGITSCQYQEHLAARLRDMEARLASVKDPAARPAAALQLASFALTQVVEDELTRVWLLRRPHAREDKAPGALAIARRALFQADQLRQRSGAQVLDPHDAASLARLRALLAIEQVLLGHAGAAEALRAADKADALLEEMPQAARPGWNLLIAACLHEAGKTDDALLRLQLVLRRYDGSPSAVPAAILQSRMLADAGNYAAAIALLSEYLQLTRPVAADQTRQLAATGAPVEKASVTRPAGRATQCTLALMRADLAGEWADKLARSASQLDRQTANRLREQAARWHAEAQELGPNLVRLLPVLRGLDVAARE